VEAARENLARVRRRLEGEVASLYASREGLFQSWRASQEALDRVSGVAALTGRAYALGETGLADLLSIRRQEQDARLQESMARTDACEVFYRLSLDTHALWPMDPSDHP
jgi:outer membrane protein TolC